MAHDRYTGLTDLLRKRLADPNGVRSTEIDSHAYPTTKILVYLKRLARQGEAFPVFFGHKNTRWYGTQEAADKALAKIRERQKQGFNSFVLAPQARTSSREWQEAQPVITSETKVTVGPAYRPRFQALEVPGLHGGLQRGRVAR